MADMDTQAIALLFSLGVLVMSVVIHEVAHGVVADNLGDPTARLAGRLTLNPLKHLDPVGSFLVPGFLLLVGGPVFGWARPVPYNPYNLRAGRWGPALVAGAGPLANLLIAVIFGLGLRYGLGNELLVQVVLLNLVLAIFNLIPVPPLDGSKLLFALLPDHLLYIEDRMNRYQLFLIFFLIVYAWRLIFPLVPFIFKLIVG